MKTLGRALLIGALCAFGSIAHSASLKELRKAEKIALTLTGKPLTDELEAAFLRDEITLDKLTEQLSKSPDFIERYAHFWLKTLGFQGPVDANSLRLMTNNRTLFSINRGQVNVFIVSTTRIYTKQVLADIANNLEIISIPALEVVRCPDGPLIVFRTPSVMREILDKAVDQGIGPDGKPIVAGTQAEWARIRNFFIAAVPLCREDTPRVKPWWDPETVTYHGVFNGSPDYRVSTFVLEKCGPALEKCSLTSSVYQDRQANLVNQDMTLEPAYIIAHTVAEDRPFSDILTSTATIMTGTYGEFMSHLGNPLWGNFPMGSYKDANHPIFTQPSVHDRRHYRIERNALHAGVLTTPAYQLLTNGNRAKANKAYETFLCRKFVVPEGGQPDPSDANPDLTKRAYCSFCHKTLEPMAAFFNRWPAVGDVNYAYNPATTVNDQGRFDGKEGAGAAAFGKIMSESESFAECSIMRAFEFVNGRKMTSVEKENTLSDYLDKFKQSGQNMRLTIKALLLKPEFLSSKGE